MVVVSRRSRGCIGFTDTVRKALKEGEFARSKGCTWRNPYTEKNGQPIAGLAKHAEAWQRGFNEGGKR